MTEKVTYGIKNVHYAPITISESGTVTYGSLVALPGASEISLSTVGEPKKVYADNVTYAKFSINSGYNGNLSIYNIPDDFAQNHLGCTKDSNGVLVEDSAAVSKDFALLFEFNTDTAKTKRNILYNVSASRSEISSKTKEDSIDPQAFSIPLVAAPASDTEYVKASIVGDSTDATWSSWFSSVYTPALTTQYLVTITVNDGTTAIADAFVYCGGKIARTDSAGKVYFMLANGTYDILVSDETHTAGTSTVTVSSAAASATVSLSA